MRPGSKKWRNELLARNYLHGKSSKFPKVSVINLRLADWKKKNSD